MKAKSAKLRNREAEALPVRLALIERIGRCECCGKRFPPNMLACHEVAGGQWRQKALDQPYALLVVCQVKCHAIVQDEPKERQLARQYLSDAGRYDLEAFWRLRCRREVPTQAEVDAEMFIDWWNSQGMKAFKRCAIDNDKDYRP